MSLGEEIESLLGAWGQPPRPMREWSGFTDFMWEAGRTLEWWKAQHDADPCVVFGTYPEPGRYVALWRVQKSIRFLVEIGPGESRAGEPDSEMGVVCSANDAAQLVMQFLAGLSMREVTVSRGPPVTP